MGQGDRAARRLLPVREDTPDAWCKEAALDQDVATETSGKSSLFSCDNARDDISHESCGYQDQCQDDSRYDQLLGVSPPCSEITAAHRANVVDGMIAAAARLGVTNDALFLAVGCLDRYLAADDTPLQLLQPLGITCLWTAAKYDCAAAPSTAAFAGYVLDAQGAALCDEAAAINLLVSLEARMLCTLDYRLASITTAKQQKHELLEKAWGSGAIAALDEDKQQQLYSMVSYLTEVSLLEYQLLPCPCSQLAAAAYVLAHVLLGIRLDCKLLSEVTGYTFPELRITLQYLCALHTTLTQAIDNGRPYAVTVKYCSEALGRVACVQPLLQGNDPRLAL